MKTKSITKDKSLSGNIILHLLFLIVAACCVLPLFLVLGISFSDESTVIRSGYRMIPRVFSLDAYRFIFKEGQAIFRAYWVSIVSTVLGTLLTTGVVTLYAYPISRKDFRFNRLFTFFIIFPLLFSAGIVPWYYICVKVLGLRNTLTALFLPYGISPFYVIIMKTFLKQSIPSSLLESAKIDGASEYRILFSVVLPLATPGLATIAFFSCIQIWNDYRLPLYLITDPQKYNIQFLLYRIQSQIQFLAQISGNAIGSTAQDGIPGHSARMALCILAVGPILLCFPFFQRYFVQGLTIGAIKG